MKNKIKKNGFTLIELLVVISIISILTMISVSSFITAQVKGRDSQRKSDLDGLSKALMMYYNDNGRFPDSVNFGNETPGLIDPNNPTTIYMRKTPIDPKNITPYTYVYKVDSTNFKKFNLFANLENTKDSQCQLLNGVGKYSVNGKNYCYGVSSPNTILKDW